MNEIVNYKIDPINKEQNKYNEKMNNKNFKEITSFRKNLK